MSLLQASAPAAKFKNVGDIVGGVVTRDSEEMQQRDFDTGALLTWDDGNPRMQLVVTVQTEQVDPTIEDDDGVRTFYAKGDMLRAVRQAAKKARLRGEVIPEGSRLYVEFIGEEPLPRGKRGYPKKLYAAVLTLPAERVEEVAEPTALDRLAGHHGRVEAARKDSPPF